MFPIATGIYYLIQSMEQTQEKGGVSLTHEGTELRILIQVFLTPEPSLSLHHAYSFSNNLYFVDEEYRFPNSKRMTARPSPNLLASLC